MAAQRPGLTQALVRNNMTFPQLEKCELCGSHSPLLRSHIIPAFVYRFVMAGTSRFYNALSPKKFVQGGERVHLLCQQCESCISLFEREFQTAFFPESGIASLPVNYGSGLYRFCCSVSWRVLTHMKLSQPLQYVQDSKISNMLLGAVPKEHHDACDHALDRWAKTILTGSPLFSDQHIVFLNGKLVPFERSDIVGFHIYQSKASLTTVAILGPIVLLGFIRPSTGWKYTEVHPMGGQFPIISQTMPVNFARWLHDLYFNLERVAH